MAFAKSTTVPAGTAPPDRFHIASLANAQASTGLPGGLGMSPRIARSTTAPDLSGGRSIAAGEPDPTDPGSSGGSVDMPPMVVTGQPSPLGQSLEHTGGAAFFVGAVVVAFIIAGILYPKATA